MFSQDDKKKEVVIMSDILFKCLEFILINIVTLITGLVAFFAGACLVLFSPIIALWFVIDERYIDDEKELE